MPFKLNPFTSDFDYYSTTSAIHASSHEIGGADLVDHDNLTNFVANEHIDWTADQGAVNIHVGNYADNDTTDHTALSNIGTKTHAQIDTHLNSDGSDHADVASNTTNIGTNTTAIGLNTTHRGSNGSDHSKVTANETAIAFNTTHRSSDGSNHSKVGANETAIALNTTHRGSNGSDHSKVTANETATALNTTHRGSSGSDHSDVVANTTARHTQGADTTLGVMTADINMNSLQQVVNLQLPAASGEAIRQTIKITETNMEAVHDHVSATGNQHEHDTHDHSTALGTAIAADLSDITSPGARIELVTNHIGDMALQNMLMNGGFEETDGTNAYYWQSGTGIETVTSGGDNSNKYLKLTRSGSDKFCRQYTISGAIRYFEVNESEIYEFGASMKSDGTCTAYLQLAWYDKDKVYISSSALNSTSATWEIKSLEYFIPSTAKFLRILAGAMHIDGWGAFDNVYLKRMDEKAWSFTHASDRDKIDEAKIYQREYFPSMKSGVDQATAGAAAGELWQDTNDDNTVKMGV